VTVVTCTTGAACFSARQAAGASSARHSLRPLSGGRDLDIKPRAKNPRRDRGTMSQRHCERSEAIHSCLLAALWIASRSLSLGAHSRDPLARNDVSSVVPASAPGPIITGRGVARKSLNSFLQTRGRGLWVPARRPGRHWNTDARCNLERFNARQSPAPCRPAACCGCGGCGRCRR
jgi:hypothetical protein